MPGSRSSRRSGGHRGRSRDHDGDFVTTYVDMEALRSVHPNPLKRMARTALDDTIAAQERLCMTKDNEAQCARTVLAAMLVERHSQTNVSHASDESTTSSSRSSSPSSVVHWTPSTAPKYAGGSPRPPINSSSDRIVNRTSRGRDDTHVDRGPVRNARLTRRRTASFIIRGGLKVDVPIEQINAHNVADLRANVIISNWPFSWSEHKMLTMISTLDGQLPVGKPIISAVVFTERRNVGGFGGQIMLRMGNASLAQAVISIFNGRLTYDSLPPLKAVQMHTEVSLIQDRDHPGLVPGQVRINEQVWNLADANLTPDPYRNRHHARKEDHVNAWAAA